MLDNALTRFAVLSENRIIIDFDKLLELERANLDVKISLVHIYRQLKSKYPEQDVDEWALLHSKPDGEVFHNLYETLRNSIRVKFGGIKSKCELLVINSKEIERRKPTIIKNNESIFVSELRFFVVKRFLKDFKTNQSLTLDHLFQRFVSLLNTLGVNNIGSMQALLHLHQIAGNKKNYEIFLLMFTRLSHLSALPYTNLQLRLPVIRAQLLTQQLRYIGVITPEYGEFVKVGGLAVMIEDLCNGLAAEGESVSVVLPYYDKDKAGNQDYLRAKGAVYLHNITVSSMFVNYEIGVHRLVRGRLNFYFLHNAWLFPSIYQTVA